jgi:hypothetical protein
MPGLLLIYLAILSYSDRFGRYQALAGRQTPCVAEAVIVRICRMRPGITPELARLEIVSGLMNLGTSCADFKGAGI